MISRRSLLSAAAIGLLSGRQSLAASVDLRAVADRKAFRFGSAIDPADLERPDAVAVFRETVNAVTPRNQLKWNATERSPGTFNFGDADRIVAFAEANGMRVYGHTLIWYRVPGWVDKIDNPADMEKAMRRHIHTLVSRYKGRIDAWDVVNEVFEYDGDQLRNSAFQRVLGVDHIEKSFLMAHEADPAATLVINDTHLEKKGNIFDAKRKAMLDLLERLVARKVPVGAVGLQAHFRPGLDELDHAATAAFCRRLKDMGLGVYITELDASCHAVKRVKGFKPASYAAIFGDIITVAAENGDLKGATVWGLQEKYGEVLKKQAKNAACHKRVNLFDEDDNPRSAIEGIKAALQAL